jgi:transposase
MVILGVDAHKHTHTVVAVDDHGRQLGSRTVGTSTGDHLALLTWACQWSQRRWAVEDCRHLSRRLERDLLAAGELVMRVTPKLMAGVWNSARTYGKSDPIDALAVARAALRAPGLPIARLDGPEREVRLLVDHREDLVAERTRVIGAALAPARARPDLGSRGPCAGPGQRLRRRRGPPVSAPGTRCR